MRRGLWRRRPGTRGQDGEAEDVGDVDEVVLVPETLEASEVDPELPEVDVPELPADELSAACLAELEVELSQAAPPSALGRMTRTLLMEVSWSPLSSLSRKAR